MTYDGNRIISRPATVWSTRVSTWCGSWPASSWTRTPTQKGGPNFLAPPFCYFFLRFRTPKRSGQFGRRTPSEEQSPSKPNPTGRQGNPNRLKTL